MSGTNLRESSRQALAMKPVMDLLLTMRTVNDWLLVDPLALTLSL